MSRLTKNTSLIIGAATSLLVACSKTDPDIEAGETVFNATCKVCHAGGINGAPILGNAKMWSERQTQSLETLVSHAEDGYGLMPAKGGNADLTRKEIEQAVKYMLAQLETP